MATATTNDTRGRILDAARELVQTRGYDGFSYADVAGRVGVRKASIHHHFPTKGDLGLALVEQFRADCRVRLGAIDGEPDPVRRLHAYVGLFRETFDAGRMCLCGALSAGFANLPGPVREAVLAALGDQESWLAGVLRDGRRRGLIRPGPHPADQARSLVSGLEGALLLALAYNDRDRFDAAARSLLGVVVAAKDA